jgi:hypothetical protein
MAKSKTKTTKKPSVKIDDLTPSSNPAGGFSKISVEYKEQKPPTTTTGTVTTTYDVPTTRN